MKFCSKTWGHCLELSFLPSLFSLEICKDKRELFGLPLHMAGLDIALVLYMSSVHFTILLVKSIISKVPFEFDAHVTIFQDS